MRKLLQVVVFSGAALGLAVRAVGAQGLAQQVEAVGTGTVRFSFPSAPGVCGNGGRHVALGGTNGSRAMTGGVRTHEWEDECEPGPVRVSLDVAQGVVTAVRSYVGGRWRSTSDADLGQVSPDEASDYLLRLAEHGEPRVAKNALLPAIIAEGVSPWRRLLTLARDERRPRDVRRSAVFWMGQAASELATTGLQEIVDDSSGDQDVRKSAVFALSQRPEDESVPALIRIARTHANPELRRAAIFWLGQSKDARALRYFEEVLVGK